MAANSHSKDCAASTSTAKPPRIVPNFIAMLQGDMNAKEEKALTEKEYTTERVIMSKWRKLFLKYMEQFQIQVEMVKTVLISNDFSMSSPSTIRAIVSECKGLEKYFDRAVIQISDREHFDNLIRGIMLDFTTLGTRFAFGKKDILRSIQHKDDATTDQYEDYLNLSINYLSMAVWLAPSMNNDVYIDSSALRNEDGTFVDVSVYPKGTLKFRPPTNSETLISPLDSQRACAAAMIITKAMQNAFAIADGKARPRGRNKSKLACPNGIPKLPIPPKNNSSLVHKLNAKKATSIEGHQIMILPELADAYTQRAGKLHKLDEFETCLADIKLALNAGYVEFHQEDREELINFYGLYMDCLLELEMPTEAKHLLSIAREYFDSSQDLEKRIENEEKVFKLFGQKETLADELVLTRQFWPKTMDNRQLKVLSYYYFLEHNSDYAGFSKKVDIAFNELNKAYVIANEEIRVGEVVMAQMPLTKQINRNFTFLYCANCYKSFRGWMCSMKANKQGHFNEFAVNYPCRRCTYCLYCSPECSELHWKTHRYECNYYILLDSIPLVALAYKLVIKVGLRTIHFFMTEDCNYFNLSGWRAHFAHIPVIPEMKRNTESHSIESEYKNIMRTLKDVDDKKTLATSAFYAAVLLEMAINSGFLNDQLVLILGTDLMNNYIARSEWIQFLAGIFFMHIAQSQQAVYEIKALDPPKFNYLTRGELSIGYGIYPHVTYFNKVCTPNSTVLYDCDLLAVRATQIIQKGTIVTLPISEFNPNREQLIPAIIDEIEGKYRPTTCECEKCTVDNKTWKVFVEKFKRNIRHFPLVYENELIRQNQRLACNVCKDLIVLSNLEDKSAVKQWTCRSCQAVVDDVTYLKKWFQQHDLAKNVKETMDYLFKTFFSNKNEARKEALYETMKKLKSLCHCSSPLLRAASEATYLVLMYLDRPRVTSDYLTASDMPPGRLKDHSTRTAVYFLKRVTLDFHSTILRDLKTIPESIEIFQKLLRSSIFETRLMSTESPTDYFAQQQRELTIMTTSLEKRHALSYIIQRYEIYQRLIKAEQKYEGEDPKYAYEDAF